MTEATFPYRVFKGHFRSIFTWALVIATVAPLFCILFVYHVTPLSVGAIPLFDLITLIGATHVFASLYLISDKQVRTFFLLHPIKMIAVPVGFVLLGLVAFSHAGNVVFIPALFAYSLYAVWHYGAQNIGVATFISVASRVKPLAPQEKRVLRASAFCGMLGTLKILQPDFMIGRQYVAIDPNVLKLVDGLYFLGSYLAVVLTCCGFFFFVRACLHREFMHGISMLMCVIFLFTMYVTTDFALGFGAFAAAHGLQYLVFLFTHTSTVAEPKYSSPFGFVAPLVLLIALMVIAHLIWTNSGKMGLGFDMPLFGMGLVFGITLAHFWVDQFLWRMKDNERAAWIKQRYSFLFHS